MRLIAIQPHSDETLIVLMAKGDADCLDKIYFKLINISTILIAQKNIGTKEHSK